MERLRTQLVVHEPVTSYVCVPLDPEHLDHSRALLLAPRILDAVVTRLAGSADRHLRSGFAAQPSAGANNGKLVPRVFGLKEPRLGESQY